MTATPNTKKNSPVNAKTKSRTKTKEHPQTKRTALVVLGMHRSGTSALAGTLGILGADLPKTPIPASGSNEKGYFESHVINDFHEDLLHSAASCWQDWLEMPQGWFESPRTDEFRKRAARLVEEEFGESSLFVLKDPRSCRFVQFWEDVLLGEGIEPHYVLINRNPLEVAASLLRRDSIDQNLGLLIWLRHVLDSEAMSRGRKRVFVNYTGLIRNWAKVVETIQTNISLRFPRMSLGVANEVENFLSAKLQHHQESTDEILQNPLITSWVKDTYEIMERWVKLGEDSADFTSLDAIRESLGSTAPAFARLVQAGSESARQTRELSDEKNKISTQLADANTSIAALTEKLEQAQNENDKVEAKYIEAHDVQSEMAQQLAVRQQELESRSDELNSIKATVKDLQKKLTESDDALQQSRLEVEERARALQELKEARSAIHAARDKELQTRNAELTSAEARVEHLQHKLAEINSALQQRRHEAEESARALQELREARSADQAAHESLMTTLQDELKQAQNSYEKAEAARVSEEKIHGKQTAKLSDKVTNLESQLQTKTHELAEITRMLSGAEEKLKIVFDEQLQERNRVEEMEAALDEAHDRAARAEHSVMELTGSTSWKLTAPVRTVAILLKRIT
ncbi:hypothetical protein FDP25_08800 [Roseovarius sp. A21]|uniref:Sulfotransferase family protein n=1 Tax=Roseovarius bejariae TaxID=2576383 RepID=A0A844CPX7_9RHOB|nr:hypothetical protein [Roseovarius bejariae]MRU15525.1 hypothetical protein [Roseovarius bejariae]